MIKLLLLQWYYYKRNCLANFDFKDSANAGCSTPYIFFFLDTGSTQHIRPGKFKIITNTWVDYSFILTPALSPLMWPCAKFGKKKKLGLSIQILQARLKVGPCYLYMSKHEPLNICWFERPGCFAAGVYWAVFCPMSSAQFVVSFLFIIQEKLENFGAFQRTGTEEQA